MQLISTTQLRTKSSQLIKTLEDGKTIDLIHRSRVIGRISPTLAEPKPFDAKKFLKLSKKLNLPVLSYKEREGRYRKHLIEKYGQGIS